MAACCFGSSCIIGGTSDEAWLVVVVAAMAVISTPAVVVQLQGMKLLGLLPSSPLLQPVPSGRVPQPTLHVSPRKQAIHSQQHISLPQAMARQPGSFRSPIFFLSQRPAGRAGSSRADRDEQWLHDKAPGFEGGRASDESRPRHNPTTSDDPSAKLVITNLHYEVSEKDLAVRPPRRFVISILTLKNSPQSLFGQFGTFVRGPTIRVRSTLLNSWS